MAKRSRAVVYFEFAEVRLYSAFKPVLDQAGSSMTVFLVGFKKASEQSSWMVRSEESLTE